MTIHMLYSFICMNYYDDTGMSNGNLFFYLIASLLANRLWQLWCKTDDM